jgi:hypothetical protein
MASSEYVLHATKGVKESFDLGAAASILEYKDARIFTFETTTEWSEIFNSTEGISVAKKLTEFETPDAAAEAEGYQVSLSAERFGGAILVSEEDQLRMGDNTTMVDLFLTRQRNDLMTDNRNLFLTSVFELLNDAFAGSVYLAPDAVALCGTHAYKSGAHFTNKSTSVFSSTAIDELETYAGAFVDATGKPRPLTFDTIIVKKGSENARTAKKLFGMNGMVPTKVADINIYEGEYTLIETPYITSANKNFWFALASREKNPLYVGIAKMPSMNEPFIDKNLSVFSAVTGFWKVGITHLPVAIFGSDGSQSGS